MQVLVTTCKSKCKSGTGRASLNASLVQDLARLKNVKNSPKRVKNGRENVKNSRNVKSSRDNVKNNKKNVVKIVSKQHNRHVISPIYCSTLQQLYRERSKDSKMLEMCRILTANYGNKIMETKLMLW